MTANDILSAISENEILRTTNHRLKVALREAETALTEAQNALDDKETEIGELQAVLAASMEDCDGCNCGDDEHYNDTNANEDFLKELALILANDETIEPSEIPQLLTDIVTAIKDNTAR